MRATRPETISLLQADVYWLAVVSCLCFALGVGGDYLLRPEPLGLRYRTPAEAVAGAADAQELIAIIGIDELEDILGEGAALILDARPREIFELGHIPGAKSLSREQFASDFAAMETVLRAARDGIVVYCADITCEDGAVVARSLREKGLSSLSIYAGGYDEWEASGKPVESSL